MRTLRASIELVTRGWDPAVVRSLLLIGVVLLVGTAGFALIEGWTLWESLFFTLITVTTVGYGDHGVSPAGERFTAFVMIGGIGAVSYAIGQLFSTAIARTLRPEKRMQQRAAQLSGHHIVCGYGRVGRLVVRRLAERGAPFVVIDPRESNAEIARNDGHIAFAGDPTEDVTLVHAGVDRASTLSALSSSDAVNALVCITARTLAPDVRIVARAEQREAICKLQRAGASRVVCPTSAGADGVTRSLLDEDNEDVELDGQAGGAVRESDDATLRLSRILITRDSPLNGIDVGVLWQRHPSVVVVATSTPDGGLLVRPGADHMLHEGETLVIAGTLGVVRGIEPDRAAA
ncbi:MAG: potassium channel family protein [Planctomycetota bacterium]